MLCSDGKQLEDGSVFPTNDDTIMDKSDGGRYVLAANIVGGVGHMIMGIPDGQGGVYGDGSEGVSQDVKVERYHRLTCDGLMTWGRRDLVVLTDELVNT